MQLDLRLASWPVLAIHGGDRANAVPSQDLHQHPEVLVLCGCATRDMKPKNKTDTDTSTPLLRQFHGLQDARRSSRKGNHWQRWNWKERMRRVDNLRTWPCYRPSRRAV